MVNFLTVDDLFPLLRTTFSRKLVAEWRRLPRFPAKMRLVHGHVLLSVRSIDRILEYESAKVLYESFLL